MRSVVMPRPERALLLVNSMANLLRALLVLCLCQATAALAREALRTFTCQALID